MSEHGGADEPPRRPVKRGPSAPPRQRAPETDQDLLDGLRAVRDRALERETDRHLREPDPAPAPRPARERARSRESARAHRPAREPAPARERAPAREPAREPARTPERGPVPGPDHEAAPAPRTPSSEDRRAERGTDEGETARREAFYRALERSTGPMLPVLPWQLTPRPRPTPPPPDEYLPPETVTSDPTLPPRSFEPPRAYYTPTEPPPPPPPPPMSPPPQPMSYAPDYTFPERIRIGQAWKRERARRHLEFAQRYGTTEALQFEGPDGRPVLVAPDLPPPRDPEVVAGEVILEGYARIQEGADALTSLSEQLREGSLEAADDIHVLFDPVREWIREHRGELTVAEVLLDARGLTDAVLELIDFLQNALSLLMGIGTGFVRGGLELLPGILSLLQLLYNLLQWLVLEDLAARAEEHERYGFALPALVPLEYTPDLQRLLEERRRWARELRDGLRRALDDWRAEYEEASPDRRANMIGQIIGQILFEIATARATAPRTPTGGAGTAVAATAGERAEQVIVGVTADGAAVARQTVPIRAVLDEAADRLAGMLQQLGPPQVMAAEGAAVMSAAALPDDPPPPSAGGSGGEAGGGAGGGSRGGAATTARVATGRATRARGTRGRGTGGGARGTRPRHPTPPSPQPTPRRRLSPAARRRLADRFTALEAQARGRVPLLRQLEDVQRRIRATGMDPADVPPGSALGLERAELLRRLGLEGVQRGEDAVELARLRLQGAVRTLQDLRRSARYLRLDDEALQALLDLDLEDHVALSGTAYRVRRGHREGYSRAYLRRRGVELREHLEIAERLELRPEDSVAMASTRRGVRSNIAGALIERLGQRAAETEALRWARSQSRRLGLAGEPVRGRLYAYRYATRRIRGTDRVRRIIVRTEIGDPGAYVVPGDDGRLTLLVFPESKLSDVLTVTSDDIAAQTAGAMRRTREGLHVEFIADDGRVFDCPPGGVRAGDHTMLVTYGARDGGAHSFTSLPEGFGEHHHVSVPMTRDQARELAAHYAAAIPERRTLPPARRTRPRPRSAERQP